MSQSLRNCAVDFTTVYPGSYSGRAVHIHFKLRLVAGMTRTYELTSQFFMVESLTFPVHAPTGGYAGVINLGVAVG